MSTSSSTTYLDGLRRRHDHSDERSPQFNSIQEPHGDGLTAAGHSKEGPPRPTTPPPPNVQDNPPPPDEKQCRICLAGEEESHELGRLFRPCRCRGSMKYVHVKCLDQWRKASASRKAFWACDQCGYKYVLARTKAVGLADSPLILGITTVIIFTCLVFLSSFLVSTWWPDLDPAHSASFLDTYSTPPSSVMAGRAPATDLIKFAVRTVNSFALREGDDDDEDGDVFGTLEGWAWWYLSTPEEIAYERTIREVRRARERAKQRGASNRRRHPDKRERQKEEASLPPVDQPPKEKNPPGLLYRLIQRFILGTSFVGMMSFLHILISLSFYAPSRILQGTRSLFGRRGRDRVNGFDIGTAVIFVFVAIGLTRVVYVVYNLNRYIAQVLLSRAETAIVEVQEEEDFNHPRARTPVWKRAWTKVTKLWRQLTDWIGDPLEPWYLKVFKLVTRLGIWTIGRLLGW